jgi:ribosomal protein L27
LYGDALIGQSDAVDYESIAVRERGEGNYSARNVGSDTDDRSKD